jgi:hypothetical protein
MALSKVLRTNATTLGLRKNSARQKSREFDSQEMKSENEQNHIHR